MIFYNVLESQDGSLIDFSPLYLAIHIHDTLWHVSLHLGISSPALPTKKKKERTPIQLKYFSLLKLSFAFQPELSRRLAVLKHIPY
ncbi:hypothetical protein VP01_2520g1 [Puccinia sorghi]|uniref:Uncharacterized protein n=1 Tax=Puccinia sorghi TaxID=27349 RepID=A0A0L6V649_9BASI|nr:hypothetical protein VP01_2520g1 [Puccinia sorghi]